MSVPSVWKIRSPPARLRRESLMRSCTSSKSSTGAASSADRPAAKRSSRTCAHTEKSISSALTRRARVASVVAVDSSAWVSWPLKMKPRERTEPMRERRSGKPICS